MQEEIKNEKSLILAKMDKDEITVATTVWLKLYFVKTVGRYLEESIGITEGRGQSFGDASADLKIQEYFVMREQLEKMI